MCNYSIYRNIYTMHLPQFHRCAHAKRILFFLAPNSKYLALWSRWKRSRAWYKNSRITQARTCLIRRWLCVHRQNAGGRHFRYVRALQRAWVRWKNQRRELRHRCTPTRSCYAGNKTVTSPHEISINNETNTWIFTWLIVSLCTSILYSIVHVWMSQIIRLLSRLPETRVVSKSYFSNL